MRKNVIALCVALAVALMAAGQEVGLHRVSAERVASDAEEQPGRGEDTSRWQFHTSLGTGVTVSRHVAQPFMWVAPRWQYEASSRLSLGGGFMAVGTLGADRQLQGLGPKSLAPRKHTTQLAGAHVEAVYSPSEHLLLWARMAWLGGWGQPWFDPTGEALPVNAFAVDGGFEYRFDNNNTIGFSLRYVRDERGTAWTLHDPNYWVYSQAPYPYCW